MGKLLIDAQGGEERAKYGNGLIKEYSKRLFADLNIKYDTTSLKRMRQFYLMIQKGAPLEHQLTWSHYKILIPLKNSNEIKYYIKICKEQFLSKREFQARVKSNEYERLSDGTRLKLLKNKTEKIEDFIKNPIIIRGNNTNEIFSEKILKKLILEDISHFLIELGNGYSFIKEEYKIKIGDKNNYIDLLLFNYICNAFVVLELKITELKKEHIGQISVYMKYIDKNIKTIDMNNTIGIIICKKDNKFLMEYCSDERVKRTTYKVKI